MSYRRQLPTTDGHEAANVIDLVVPRTMSEQLGGATIEDNEIGWLRREQEKVGERLDRLRKMEQLENEHRQPERRINERLIGR